MSKPIVTTTYTGVVKEIGKKAYTGSPAYVLVKPDNGGEDIKFGTLNAMPFEPNLGYSVGDKVRYTIIDGTHGPLVGGLEKAS